MGFYALLTAQVPSRREEARTVLNDLSSAILRLMSPGFAMPRKPGPEDQFDERTTVWFYGGLGAVFTLIGALTIVQLSLKL